jgi:hypothetical protein
MEHFMWVSVAAIMLFPALLPCTNALLGVPVNKLSNSQAIPANAAERTNGSLDVDGMETSDT